MLWMRIATAVIGIPLILALVYWGGWPLLIFTGAVMVVGAGELGNMGAKMGVNFPRWPLISGLVLLCPAAYWGGISWILAVAVLEFMLILIMLVAAYPRWRLADGLASWGSFCYLSCFLSCYLVRELDPSRVWLSWLLLILVSVWVCDSAAYFVGRAWGKRKLLPQVSPGKTVAGAVGGLGGCLAVAIVFAALTGWDKLGIYLLLAVVAGVFGPLGDLGESVIKRSAGVKDSGNLIPGHGGVLDRFDALLVVLPLAYGILKLGNY